MRIKRIVLFLVLALVLSAGCAAAQGRTLVDFEAEQPLAGEEAFRYVVHTTDWASQGERSARAVHRAISVDRKGFVAWRGETDWTGYDTFMFDFYNPLDVPVEIAIYVQTSPNWNWYESETQLVPAGEQFDVTFSLTEATWKGEETNWEHSMTPPLADLLGWGILVYPTEVGIPEGSLYFDNIRLGGEGAPVQEKTPSGSSPIAFRPGDWAMGVGDGKLTFEDNTVHVTDYTGWKLLQMGANTTGVIDLSGYTGIRFEAQVSEPTTLELALQLEDWAWQVVHRKDLDPSDGWALIEVDLTGYDLSHINALCFQTAGGDWSLRNIYPTPWADASAAADGSARVRLSGKAYVDITLEKVEITGDSPIAFKEGDWVAKEDKTVLEFATNEMKVRNYPAWTQVEMGTNSAAGALDLTGYTAIRFEVSVPESNTVQFIIQPEDWGWNQLWSQWISADDGWVTVDIDLTTVEFDLGVINALVFQGGGDFNVRNIVLLPMPEPDTSWETGISYGADIKLTYDLSDDWTAVMEAKVNQDSFKIGLMEAKGRVENANVRIFLNGTGADLGDPMGIIKGAKYYEDKTAGVDVRVPVLTGSTHALLSTPLEDRDSTLVAGSIKMPVPFVEGVEAQLLAATEFIKAEDNDTVQPYVVSGAVTAALPFDVKVTGQAAYSGGKKDGLGLFAKAAYENFEAGVTHAPTGLWTDRSDHNDDGYGTYYIQGNFNIIQDVLSSGFYFNQWYNHNEEQPYKNWFGKVYADWNIVSGVTLNTVFEQKWAKNFDSGKYDKLEESKLIAHLKATLMEDLNGQLTTIITHENGKHLKVPGYMLRLTYTGLPKLTLLGEYGLSKKSSAGNWDHNVHLKATYKFSDSGSLALGYGKATLNSDENAIVTRSTPPGYYTLSFTYNF